MSPRRLVALFFALAIAVPCAAQTPRQLIDRARVHLENIQGDSAHPLLARALSQNPSDAERLRGFTLLGIAELLRSNRFAARSAFERALRLDPTLRVDSLDYLQDDVKLVFAEARTIVGSVATQGATVQPPTRTAPTLTIHVAPDTLVSYDNARLAIGIELTAPARVVSSIVSADAPTREIWADTQRVSARQPLAWPLRRSDGTMLAAGRYILRAQATDSAGLTSPMIEKRLRIARARADTQPLPPPLAASAFLPEKAASGGSSRNVRTLVAGGALALLIAATPMVLAEPSLNEGVSSDPTAPAVAGGVAIASVIGYLKSGKATPMIAENVQKNRELRDNDRRQREAIIKSNATAVERAPIRVTVEP